MGPRRATLRAALVAAHRIVGLAIAAFLIVAGATGAVLAFGHELDAALNPELFRVPVLAGAAPGDPVALRDSLEASLPTGARVTSVPLDTPPGRALVFRVVPAHQGGDDEVFVHPVTGAVLGSRRWGDLAQGRKNLVPFLYRLHTSLALGTVGDWLLGIVALLWTVDCVVAASITWPSPAPVGEWLRRWRPAWLLRTQSLFSFLFTWHRASGLWVWGMLLVFASSGVAMNLEVVYHPIMSALGSEAHERAPARPNHPPPRSYRDLLETARRAAAEEARARGFEVLAERRLVYEPERGIARYQVRSTRDISDRYPGTTIEIDAATGEPVRTVLPTGVAAADTFTTWILHLHFGSVAAGGVPYRVFVLAMGVLVAALSASGVYLFVRRKLRGASARRSPLEGRPENGPSTPAR